jgi:hypothetical protein
MSSESSTRLTRLLRSLETGTAQPVSRRGGRLREAGTGRVEVAGKGAGQIEAGKLGSPLSRGVSVVCGAIPLACVGAAKGFVGGGEEAEEGGGASGTAK